MFWPRVQAIFAHVNLNSYNSSSVRTRSRALTRRDCFGRHNIFIFHSERVLYAPQRFRARIISYTQYTATRTRKSCAFYTLYYTHTQL